jgi:hypothetical protein
LRTPLSYLIDAEAKTITRDSAPIARFNDVCRVQIREISEECRLEYRLSVELKNGTKLFLGQTSNEVEVDAVAEDIADMLDVSLHRKAGGLSANWELN